MAHRFLLLRVHLAEGDLEALGLEHRVEAEAALAADRPHQGALDAALEGGGGAVRPGDREIATEEAAAVGGRSEEHTSDLQSLMRTSYAVFCLKKQRPPHN